MLNTMIYGCQLFYCSRVSPPVPFLHLSGGLFTYELSFQGSRISDSSSKTLDSASAHFAASAVVSAPGPSQAEVSKDAAGQTTNVNGVVQSAGEAKMLLSGNL